MLDFKKAVECLKVLPARSPFPPTKRDYFNKYNEYIVLFEPYEEFNDLSYDDQQQAIRVYRKVLGFMYVNCERWTKKAIARVCVEINEIFQNVCVICVYDEFSEESQQDWIMNKENFRLNAEDALLGLNIPN